MHERNADGGREGVLGSTAPAPVGHHAGQQAVDDVQVLVEVQHRDGGQLAGHAARPRARVRARRLVGQLGQVRVRVLLQEHQRTLAGTIVGRVLPGRDDPVPAELVKVHGQRVPAAPGLRGRLVAVDAQHVALGPRPPVVLRVHLQVRDLCKTHGLLYTFTYTNFEAA